jgi:hypothetical protein
MEDTSILLLLCIAKDRELEEYQKSLEHLLDDFQKQLWIDFVHRCNNRYKLTGQFHSWRNSLYLQEFFVEK